MGAAINVGEIYARLSAMCTRAPTARPALHTPLTTLVSSRRWGAPPNEANGRRLA